jgi:hypothetical protein
MKVMTGLIRKGRFPDEVMGMPAAEKAIFAQAEVKGIQYAQR